MTETEKADNIEIKGADNDGSADTGILERGEVSASDRRNYSLREQSENSAKLEEYLGNVEKEERRNTSQNGAGESGWMVPQELAQSNISGSQESVLRTISQIKPLGKDTIGRLISESLCKEGELDFHFGTLDAAHDRYIQSKEENPELFDKKLDKTQAQSIIKKIAEHFKVFSEYSKEFIDKPNRLYVAVTLEGIKKDRFMATGVPIESDSLRNSPVNISISEIFSKINPEDYDITQKLRDTAHRVNDVVRPVGNALKNGVFIQTVSQSDTVVNSNSMQGAEDNTQFSFKNSSASPTERLQEYIFQTENAEEIFGRSVSKYGAYDREIQSRMVWDETKLLLSKLFPM